MEDTISVLVIGKNGYESNVDISLAARAFGAQNITFVDRKNQKLVRQIQALNRKWGGNFAINFSDDWKREIEAKKNYKVVYLTRYGVPMHKNQYAIKTYKNILLVVTLSENFKNLFGMSDFNVSITTQPHCSAAAIAVFLHNFFEGRELAMHFENAQFKVVPEERKIHIERTK